MFDRLEKHHLGFIVPIQEKEKIESRTGRKFQYDAIQRTHVLFIYDETLGLYVEYICQEGRVARQKPGFAHICYNVQDQMELQQIEDFIKEQHMGYRLTDLERSGSRECGFVIFYFIKNHGVIELNLANKE